MDKIEVFCASINISTIKKKFLLKDFVILIIILCPFRREPSFGTMVPIMWGRGRGSTMLPVWIQ